MLILYRYLRLAVLPILVTLLPAQTHIQAKPELNNTVASFLVVPKVQFPDRTKEAEAAAVYDANIAAEKAAAELAAQQTAQAAYVAPTAYPEPTEGYKRFIYDHESGNDPGRWNSSGCVGLGQACPASKLLAVCPNLDYACEDAWFSQYAVDRYGGWYNAYIYWINHSNW